MMVIKISLLFWLIHKAIEVMVLVELNRYIKIFGQNSSAILIDSKGYNKLLVWSVKLFWLCQIFYFERQLLYTKKDKWIYINKEIDKK